MTSNCAINEIADKFQRNFNSSWASAYEKKCANKISVCGNQISIVHLMIFRRCLKPKISLIIHDHIKRVFGMKNCSSNAFDAYLHAPCKVLMKFGKSSLSSLSIYIIPLDQQLYPLLTFSCGIKQYE